MVNGSSRAIRLRRMRNFALAVAGTSLPLALAAEEEVHPEPASEPIEERDAPASNPYAALDDEELGALAASFEDLDQDERRWFLTEVRKRMSSRGERPRIPVTDRGRFGRVREASAMVREVRLEEPEPLVVISVESEVYGSGLERPSRTDPEPVSATSQPTEEPATLPRN
ncbi:MAG: hypothetical protein F4X98_09255 [Gammaproteobacteria bacterium]|nr:hypothetical protein [Gammaproteobacteria bacterium]